MSKWIKKGDKVLVIAGNDKGKVGQVFARHGERALVKGVNVRTKHMKSRQQNQPSQRVKLEIPVNVSNLVPCDADGKRIKLKVQRTGSGKELYYLKGEERVIFRTLKKAK